MPTPESGSLLQLGGYVIENVEEEIALAEIDLIEPDNLNLDGAYVLALGDSYNLVGFDHLGTAWKDALSSQAVEIADDGGVALGVGERYNLVAVVQIGDPRREASVAGVRLTYREDGIDRVAEVEERINVSPGGSRCLDG